MGCGVGGIEQPEIYVKEEAVPAGQFVVMEYVTVPTVAPAGMPCCPANSEHGWSLRVVVVGEQGVGLSVGLALGEVGEGVGCAVGAVLKMYTAPVPDLIIAPEEEKE